MKLKEVSFEQLQAENPELVKKIQESAGGSQATALVEANRKIADFEHKDKIREQNKKVEGLLKESKIPDAVKIRILESMTDLYETEEKLKEAFGEKLKKELAYLNSLPGSRGRVSIPAAGGKGTAVDAGVQNAGTLQEKQVKLEGRFGIKEAKNDDDDE